MYTPKRHYIASLLVLTVLMLSMREQATYADHGTNAWTNNGNHIYYDDGNVGIGLSNPGELLHIGDGNVLIEGGGETALKFKRDITYTGGPSGVSQNPRFELGRIIQAGDGDPEFRVLYADDGNPVGYAVFEFDRKGIVASVKQAIGPHFEGYVAGEQNRGSHLEGFIGGTVEPIFRLNSYPKMRLEMGAGGSTPVDVAVQREAANTLTLITGAQERMRVDTSGVKISTGYLQLSTSVGIPPAADCNHSSEAGRMKVDANGMSLYVCTASGWGSVRLGNTFLSSIRR
jgi:hypothetical protein